MAATKPTQFKITKQEYDKASHKCREIAISRNKKYGDSIKMCSDFTLMELCQMKLERNKNLKPSDPKYYDEVMDSVNYLTYILMRKLQSKPKRNRRKFYDVD